MQPSRARQERQSRHEQALAMERVIMSVRRLWFGAELQPRGCATAVMEHGSELLMCVDGEGEQVEELLACGARLGSFVVSTSLSHPSDLPLRLRQAGFTTVQRQAAYTLDIAAYQAMRRKGAEPTRSRGLFGFLLRPARVEPEVHLIGENDLPSWNGVCWRAFGSKGTEAASLREKVQAFRAMGTAAWWYLATIGGRPAGTAILYQEGDVAQVLAVGTHPSFQSRGVASAIMHRVIRDWQGRGGFLFLDTAPGSVAERLYVKLGFRQAYLREIWAPVRQDP